MVEQNRQWRDQPIRRESCLNAIDRSMATRGVGTNPEFHQHDRGKKTDDVADAAKNPIGIKICAQVIDKHIGVEKHFATYRYGHGRLSPFKLSFNGFMAARICSSSMRSDSARSMASCSESTPKYRFAKSIFF